MTIVPEYDDPRRTVKFITIALTVDTVITPLEQPDSETYHNTDDVMDYIRNRLSQPGQPLIIRNKGLGTIRVNTGSSSDFTDVDFGPKPQVMEFTPIAGERSLHRRS